MEMQQLVKILLGVVVLITLIGIIIVVFKGKGGELLDALIERFKLG